MSDGILKYDHLLFDILQKEGQIVPFLDTVFSFLYRRTDYYRLQTEDNSSLGFPEGVAETLLKKVFLKYYEKARKDDEFIKQQSDVPDAALEVEIGAGDSSSAQSKDSNKGRQILKSSKRTPALNDGDCYNGANLDNYKWSQTQQDLDVRVKVSSDIDSGKKITVQIKPESMCVSALVKSEEAEASWKVLAEGKFPFKVNSTDAVWTLIPGDHVHISLDKREERLWEYLLEGDPKLNIRELDNTVPMDSLDPESRVVVEELTYNQRQKMMGKPTTQQMKLQGVLKDAWDKENSPFKGQPFDPSIVNWSNSEGLSRDVLT